MQCKCHSSFTQSKQLSKNLYCIGLYCTALESLLSWNRCQSVVSCAF